MAFPRPIRAVVFDMDGLLVDTEAQILRLMMELAPVHGGHLPEAVFHKMVGLPNAASEAVARAHFGPDFPLEAYIAEVMARADAERESVGVPLKTGAVELLDLLDETGLPRAIATSSSHQTVALTLRSSGLQPRFDAVIAAGDYARGKPNPDPFLAAAARLGVAPQNCLALEDSHNGVRAASAAGMITVMAPDLLPPTDEMRRLCHAVVESLHEVRAMIRAAYAPDAAPRL